MSKLNVRKKPLPRSALDRVAAGGTNGHAKTQRLPAAVLPAAEYAAAESVRVARVHINGNLLVAEECNVPVVAVDPSPWQVRRGESEESLQGLVDSLKSFGLRQAICVRPMPNNRFELLAGHRRLEAARLAGWHTIRASIQDCTEDEAREVVLLENLQRKDLSAIEEAEGFKQILDGPKGPTQQQLADRLGVSQAHIANRLRLLRLPQPFQAAIISGEITASQGRDLVAVADLPAVTRLILEEQKRPHYKGQTLGKVLDTVDLLEFIRDGTRALEGSNWSLKLCRLLPHFTPTPEQRAELDIRKFPEYSGSKTMVERACNAELWDRLQAEHEEQLIAKAKKREDKKGGKAKAGDGETPKPLTAEEHKALAAEERRRKEKTRQQLVERRKKLVLDRLRHLIAQKLLFGQVSDEKLLELTLMAARRGWADDRYGSEHVSKALAKEKDDTIRQRAKIVLAECFWKSGENCPSTPVPDYGGYIQKVAALLEINIEVAWWQDHLGPLTEAWWNAHVKEDLLNMGGSIAVDAHMTKIEVVGILMRSRGIDCPAELKKLGAKSQKSRPEK